MKQPMTLLFHEKTLHVVGAITRTANAETEVTVEDLVGDALPSRGFAFAAGDLKVVIADADSELLLAPSTYGIEIDEPVLLNLTIDAPVYNASDELEIKLSVPVVEDTPVLVQAAGPSHPEPIIIPAEIERTKNEVKIDFSNNKLSSPDRVLILVRDRAPRIHPIP